MSARQEGEAHQPVRVVDVQVDQADALPGAERESTTQHRDRGVGRHQRRHHVRAPVTPGTVPVPPPVVGREQVTESRQQVVIRPGARLEDCDPCGGLRGEQLEQSVVLTGDERCAVVGEVEDHLDVAGAVLTRLRPHRLPSSRRCSSTRSTLAVSWPSYPGLMSALSTSPTRRYRAATTSTAALTAAITSSHSPSRLVNIALVSQGRPDARSARTASATAALTPPSGADSEGSRGWPEGLMLSATIMWPASQRA